jgi:predicted Zn-dependent protease
MQSTGWFTDGLTAALRAVAVELSAAELVVTQDGQERARWQLTALRPIDEPGSEGPLRVKCGDDGAERLTLDGPAFAAALLAAAPQLTGRLRHVWSWRRTGAWTAGVAAFVLFAVFGLPRVAEIGAALVPGPWEERLGDSVVHTVTEHFRAPRLCSTPAGDAALHRLVERLTATVATSYRPVVRVADGTMVNAFAAPGGRVVILRGLLDAAESADEVAGVLAHELGHVVERHPTEALIHALGIDFVLKAMVGDSTSVGGTLAQAGGLIAMFSYSRGREAEADRAAIAMLNRADIRGTGLAQFFARAAGRADAAPGGLDGYLSTHPPSESRAAAIRAESTGTGPAMSDAEWRALKAICGGPGGAG